MLGEAHGWTDGTAVTAAGSRRRFNFGAENLCKEENPLSFLAGIRLVSGCVDCGVWGRFSCFLVLLQECMRIMEHRVC